MLTANQLAAIMPRCPSSKVQSYATHLSTAMAEAEINTPVRQAAFMGQLAHESGELRFWLEQSDGTAYEGRKDLGNDQPGDGPRYRGRGPIQLTGRANYRAAGKALGVHLERHPEYALSPDVGFRVAAWYWMTHDCNRLADEGDSVAVTQRINGGTNGLAERIGYRNRAMEVLTEPAKETT